MEQIFVNFKLGQKKKTNLAHDCKFCRCGRKKKTLTLPPFWLKFVKFSTDASTPTDLSGTMRVGFTTNDSAETPSNEYFEFTQSETKDAAYVSSIADGLFLAGAAEPSQIGGAIMIEGLASTMVFAFVSMQYWKGVKLPDTVV